MQLEVKVTVDFDPVSYRSTQQIHTPTIFQAIFSLNYLILIYDDD